MQRFADAEPIVVVGPGRCGTSAVAGLLHQMGVQMGERFYPAHETNRYGHWEDTEFLEPNDRFVIFGKITEEQWREAVTGVIAKRVAQQRPWGWKDPRTCLLIRQYLELLPGARFIRCLRPRAAVIDSFIRAYGGHGWTEEMAANVIDRREWALDESLPEEATLRIEFENLKADRDAQIRKIVEFCQLDFVSEELLAAACEFIRKD